jgi:hypothetical protein
MVDIAENFCSTPVDLLDENGTFSMRTSIPAPSWRRSSALALSTSVCRPGKRNRGGMQRMEKIEFNGGQSYMYSIDELISTNRVSKQSRSSPGEISGARRQAKTNHEKQAKGSRTGASDRERG